MSSPLRAVRLAVVAALLATAGAAHAQDPAPEATTDGSAPAAAEASAVSPELQAIIDKVKAKYDGVDTLQATFVQVKKDSFGEVKQEGDVVLRRPNKMRWRFTSGDEQVFVSDGATLWIYTKAENQVLRITDTSQATSTANMLLTSLDSLDELFDVKLVSEEGGPTLDLTPKRQGMYKGIRLSLTPDLVLRQAVFTDAYDNVTDLSFSGVVLDSPVPDETFVFTPPEGAKVIDN